MAQRRRREGAKVGKLGSGYARAARNSLVIWRGRSELTGDPIFAVLTGLLFKSQNAKTGSALQVYILTQNHDPSEAVKSGQDRAICGDCQLRGRPGPGQGHVGRRCYVTYWQAALGVWKAMKDEPAADPWATSSLLRARVIRLGAYGDPAAVPLNVWAQLLHRAGGWVGYTQQWATCDAGLRNYCMASVASAAAAERARAMGWRTYRVRTHQQPREVTEVVCPASKEGGHRLTCEDCRLCNGSAKQNAVHVTILAHGRPGNLTAFGMPIPVGLFGRPHGRVIQLKRSDTMAFLNAIPPTSTG